MPHDAVTIYDLPFMLPATGPDRQTLEMLARTAGAALVALKSLQRTDGHWCAELYSGQVGQLIRFNAGRYACAIRSGHPVHSGQRAVASRVVERAWDR